MADNLESRIKRFVESPLFPLTAEFTLKPLAAPMTAELQRDGEGDKPCHSCSKPERVLWTNDRWNVCWFVPTANPVMLFLETVKHIDFETFDESMAAEFGVLTWRLEEAIRSISGVGRVHVHRWADGSSHFHVWFQARPAGQLEYYGWGNVLWPQLAEPLPIDVVRANHQRVVERLVGTTGGHAVGLGAA